MATRENFALEASVRCSCMRNSRLLDKWKLSSNPISIVSCSTAGIGCTQQKFCSQSQLGIWHPLANVTDKRFGDGVPRPPKFSLHRRSTGPQYASCLWVSDV